MLATSFGLVHLLIVVTSLLGILALDVVAMVEVWRDQARSLTIKIVWTVFVWFFPLVGGIGWLINWSIGRLTRRIEKSNGLPA